MEERDVGITDIVLGPPDRTEMGACKKAYRLLFKIRLCGTMATVVHHRVPPAHHMRMAQRLRRLADTTMQPIGRHRGRLFCRRKLLNSST